MLIDGHAQQGDREGRGIAGAGVFGDPAADPVLDHVRTGFHPGTNDVRVSHRGRFLVQPRKFAGLVLVEAKDLLASCDLMLLAQALFFDPPTQVAFIDARLKRIRCRGSERERIRQFHLLKPEPECCQNVAFVFGAARVARLRKRIFEYFISGLHCQKLPRIG